MPTWPYGTRRRADAPDSFHLIPSLWQTFVSGVPYSWLSPIFGQMIEIDFSTDTLCSAPPPLPETWGIDDLVNSVNPSTASRTFDKLVRVAEAGLWPALCEFTPAPDPTDGGAAIGTPRFVSNLLANRMLGADDPSDPGAHWPHSAVAATGEYWDFIVLALNYTVLPTSADLPTLTVAWVDGAYGPNTLPWVHVGVLGRYDLQSYPKSAVIGRWNPETHVVDDIDWWGFRIDVPDDPTGQWVVSADAWAFGPPQVSRWPPAPPMPSDHQFSDACAAALCNMGTQWPTAYDEIATAASGVASNDTKLNLAKLELDAILAAFPTAAPAGTRLGTGGSASTSSGFEITDNAVGVQVVTTIPPTATEAHDLFLTQWGAARIASGQFGAWWPSVQLKHRVQLYMFHPGDQYFGIVLSPLATAEYRLVIPL